MKPYIKKTFEENVLIKLRRTYSKDETVASLSKELSKCEVKYGQYESYITELKHDLNKANQELKKERQKTLDLHIKLKQKGKTPIKVNEANQKIISLKARLKNQFEHHERKNNDKVFLKNFIMERMPDVYDELMNELDKNNQYFEEFVLPTKHINL